MADSDFKIWRGGASIQTQLDTQTFTGATWTGDGAGVTYTMTDSAGNTQTVVTDVTGSQALTSVRDTVLAALNASVQTYFAAVTWASSSTDKITGTAKVGGTPFVLTVADTDTAGAVTNANTTLSQGPNDYNCDSGAGYTVSNWIGYDGAATTKPSATTHIVNVMPHQTDVDANGNPKSHAIIYGLNQSAVTVQEVHIGQSFRAPVGDAVNGFYLRINVIGTGTNGFTEINTQAPVIMLQGSATEVNVQATNGTSLNALKLAGGTIAKLYLMGGAVAGRITVADSCPVTTYVAQGISADVRIGTGTVITTAVINGGTHTILRAMGTVTTAGGVITSYGPDGAASGNTGTAITWNNHGAIVYANGPGDIGTGTSNGLKNYSGVFDLSKNRSFDDVDVYGTECWAGTITDVGGLSNINYANNPIRHGGSVLVSGATVVAA